MSGVFIGRQSCAGYLNSGEGMLAGGALRGGRPNSGEAAVVEGDHFFGCFPPAKGLLPVGGRQFR